MPKRLAVVGLIFATLTASATLAGATGSGTAAASAGSGNAASTGSPAGSSYDSGSATGSTDAGGTGAPSGAAPSSGTASPPSGATGTGSGSKATAPGPAGSGSKATGSPGSGPKAGGSTGSGTKGTGSNGSGSKGTGSTGTGSKGSGSRGAGSKSAGAPQPQEITVGHFSAGDLSGWKDQPFKGKTAYSLDGPLLKAHALKASSGLTKKVSLDARKYPKLSWSWKVDHSLRREDIKSKKGDDFAARVYVIFPRTFFWRMRAINYVWAGKMPKGSEAPSPYTSNSVIIAVESGDEKAGTLVHEERNIYEDYKKIFGEEPPQVGGVAILTDTDDTQDEATAWYGDITLGAP